MKETDRLLFNKTVFNRPDDSNKGTLGSLLCICGSYGMAGAAIMLSVQQIFLKAYIIRLKKLQTV